MDNLSLDITFKSLTNKGGRQVNEDSLTAVIMAERLAFILCDGLGGHGSGDLASQYVVGRMKQCLEENKSVEESIMLSQEGLLEKQRLEGMEDAMKTTLTCLSIAKETAKFVHVGDSRIYYFENGKYKMRSQDHSVPQMLVNSGAIKDKDIRHHEDRSRLLRVMGTEWNAPKYQVVDSIPISRDTSFLLCSDGFWELIDEKQMMKTLKKASSPEEWLNRMEPIVLKNGKGTNMDNYSAIAVFIR